MPAHRLPAVLFDLDGTLIDSIELITQSARHAFAVCPNYSGHVPTDEEWIAELGRPLPTMFGRYTSNPEELEELIAGYREFQLANHDALVRCYDGVAKTLAELKSQNHLVGIVTSKSEPIAVRGLEHAEIAKYVDAIVGLESTKKHKPDPAPVRAALSQLGVKAQDAVFVGDSPHDIQAGRAAGVITVAALWGPFTRQQLAAQRPDYFIRRSKELLSVVDRVAEEREEAAEDDEW